MRLSSSMSQEQIREALGQVALQTWGAERLDGLRSTLDHTAQAIWLVLQEPVAPLGEELDVPLP